MMSAAWTWSGDWRKRTRDVSRILWLFVALPLMMFLSNASSSRPWTIGEKVAIYLTWLLIALLLDVIHRTVAARYPALLGEDGTLALMRPHLAFWLGLFAMAWLIHYLLTE